MKIQTARDASLLINAAIYSHLEKWKGYENTENYLLRGKRPFDPQVMKDKGLDWCSNNNYGKGRAKLERGIVESVIATWQALFLMEARFKNFNTKVHKEKIYAFLQNDYLRDYFGYLITRAFFETLRSDERLQSYFGKIEYNSYCFGYCPIIRNQFTFLGTPVSVNSVAFEDRTRVGDLRTWVVFDFVKADILFDKRNAAYKLLEQELAEDANNNVDGDINDTASALNKAEFTSSGWNVEGLEEIFFKRLTQLKLVNDLYKDSKDANLKDEDRYQTFTSWEQVDKLVNQEGKVWLNLNVNNIFVAKIYDTESDGSIIETMIALTNDIHYGNLDTQEQKENITQFNASSYAGTYSNLLFQKNHGKQPYTDHINLIQEFSVTSTGFVQDLTGCGKFIAEEAVRYDYSRNAFEDKLILSGSFGFTHSEELTGQSTNLQVFGGMWFAPSGTTPIQNQYKPDLQPHISALQLNEQSLNEDIGLYNPQPHLSNRPTKDEVQFQNNLLEEAKSTKTPFKLVSYARLFGNILRDIGTKEYVDSLEVQLQDLFFDKLMHFTEEFGLEKKDLQKIIKEIDTITLSPVIKDLNAIQQAMQLATSDNAKSKLVKMLLLAFGFSFEDVMDMVSGDQFGNESTIAAFENAAFYSTGEVVFSAGQDHVTHCSMHFAKCDRVMQGVQAGEDPVKAVTYLKYCLANTAQHLQDIKTSFFYKSKFKQFKQYQDYFEQKLQQLIAEIKKMHDQMQQQSQQGQQQQQGGQLPPEVQNRIYIDRMKALDKIKRTEMLTQNSMAQRAKMFQQSQDLMEQQTKNTMDIQQSMASLKAELEKLKAATKLAHA